MKASWTRLEDGAWAVKLESDLPVVGLTGTKVEVRRKDGQTRPVTLGAMLDAWDGNRKAKYVPVRKPRSGREENVQPIGERSGQTYTVAVRVTNASGQWVEWAMPIESHDEYLPRESSPEIAKVAIHVRDVLTHGVLDTSIKTKAAPKRRSAPKKPVVKSTSRKAVA